MEPTEWPDDTRSGARTGTNTSSSDAGIPGTHRGGAGQAYGRFDSATGKSCHRLIGWSSLFAQWRHDRRGRVLSQSFELGGRRAARIAGARAGIERETATSQDVVRQLLRDVSIAFSKALAAKERLGLATGSSKIAGELLQSMERRFQAGDVPILDVNLARNSAARARADVRSAQAAYTSAMGDLQLLLGMSNDEPIEVIGDLHDRRRFDIAALLDKAGDRPDLRALMAERDEAQADVRLGNGFRSPTIAPALPTSVIRVTTWFREGSALRFLSSTVGRSCRQSD